MNGNFTEKDMLSRGADERKNKGERVVITIIGKDQTGIIAGVTDICAKSEINILDISQTILDDFFAMVMLVDIQNATTSIEEFRSKLTSYGECKALKIIAQHENLFNMMHRI